MELLDHTIVELQDGVTGTLYHISPDIITQAIGDSPKITLDVLSFWPEVGEVRSITLQDIKRVLNLPQE